MLLGGTMMVAATLMGCMMDGHMSSTFNFNWGGRWFSTLFVTLAEEDIIIATLRSIENR